MKKIIFAIILLTILLFNLGCKKDTTLVEPPNEQRDSLFLTVTDFTHHSVTLKLKHSIIKSPIFVTLKRTLNNQETEVDSFTLYGIDTTIIDDDNGNGLLLDTTYSYQVIKTEKASNRIDTSNRVTIKTLAPKSHSYTWTEYTIGDWFTELDDVWGTDENNIYAVGTINLGDSVYGIIHWNGVEWKSLKTVGGVLGIFGFSENDIWAVGGAVEHFDGQSWTRLDAKTVNYQDLILDSVLYNNITYHGIWGTNSNSLYLVSGKGIVYWDGKKGTQMVSPTKVNLTDIYGLSDKFILAAGASGIPPSVALKYNGSNWSALTGITYNDQLLYTVYPITEKEYYLGGDELYKYFNNKWKKIVVGQMGVIEAVRGDKTTGDLVVVGGVNTLLHYNGNDWYSYKSTISTDRINFSSCYVKDDLIVAVGTSLTSTRGKILMGKRSK